MTRFLRVTTAGLLIAVLGAVGTVGTAEAGPAPALASVDAGPAFAVADDRPAALAFERLRTEYRTNPIGIGETQPRFGWRFEASERGARQSAYRIQVAESPQALRNGDLLWDTGRVESGQSQHHAYDGPALDSRTRYHWRVRAWDQSGESTGWSDPAFFETGLLQTDEWSAEWIEPAWDKDSTVAQPAPMLRREFEVDGEVQSARLYITSRGLYEAHLNGRRVGTREFTPGWTAYDERLQYQTYDVTDHLKSGDNAIGVRLGDGWFRGNLGWQGERNLYGSDVALLAQLHVTYAGGRTEVVVQSEEGWAAGTGAIRASDIYDGETYDARRERLGWAQAGYDDGNWQSVTAVDHPKDVLVAPTAQPVRAIQEIEPVEVLYTPEGDTVLDMGQNMVGWVRLRVDGEAGRTVTLRHAEVLDKDGNFYTANLRSAEATDRYTLKGADGEEVYEPTFTFHGFRYVAVDNYPGEITTDDVTGVVLHTDMPPTGHFQTSHSMVNHLQHNIVWGQKGNFLDVPTDTPARDERMGWTGDAEVFVETATYNMDVAAFFTKWLRDLAADQYESGSIPHVIPDVLGTEESPAGGAPGWADAGVIVPWALYQRYGDREILATQYASMKAWVDYIREEAAGSGNPHLWLNRTHFGDWLAFNSDSPAYPGATTRKDLIATAYYARSADLLSRAAGVLGREEDATEYGALADRVREAFQEEFVTPSGRVTSSTQTAYVLALSFDLMPDSLRAEAARRLAEDVQFRGHLTTGFLGTPNLNHVLSNHGRLDTAYDLLLRTEYPSWLYPITRGATTMWERWDGIKPDSTFQTVGMNSFNHYAYGAVGDWMYRTIAGIEPTAPGYREMRIAPRPGGGMTHARGMLESLYGRIESAWTLDGDTFRLAVTVPPNTEASVRLPHASLAEVTEGGTPLSNVAAVSGARQEEDAVVLRVGSGTYDFAYPAGPLTALAETEALGTQTPLGTLLENEEARAVLEDEFPTFMGRPLVDQMQGASLRDLADRAPKVLTDDALERVDRRLEQIETGADAVDPGLGTEVGVLIANPEARAVLNDHLPGLMQSPWLSQVMAFPLEHAVTTIPVDVSDRALERVGTALDDL